MSVDKKKVEKDVTVTIGGQSFVVPAGSKVKDAASSAGIEIPALKIDPATCKGCTLCVKVCENEAVSGEKKEPHSIDPAKCVRCGECLAKCKTGSIVPA
jgi:NADH-quinone oxidoreductase subunit F